MIGRRRSRGGIKGGKEGGRAGRREGGSLVREGSRKCMSEGGWEEGGRTDRPIGRRTSIMGA